MNKTNKDSQNPPSLGYTDKENRAYHFFIRILFTALIALIFACYIQPLFWSLSEDICDTIAGVKLREVIAYPPAYDVGYISDLTAHIIYFVFTEIIIISLFALAIWYEQKSIKNILQSKLRENPQITAEHYVKLVESNQHRKPIRAIFIILQIAAIIGFMVFIYVYAPRGITINPPEIPPDHIPMGFEVYSEFTVAIETTIELMSDFIIFTLSAVWVKSYSRKKRIKSL